MSLSLSRLVLSGVPVSVSGQAADESASPPPLQFGMGVADNPVVVSALLGSQRTWRSGDAAQLCQPFVLSSLDVQWMKPRPYLAGPASRKSEIFGGLRLECLCVCVCVRRGRHRRLNARAPGLRLAKMMGRFFQCDSARSLSSANAFLAEDWRSLAVASAGVGPQGDDGEPPSAGSLAEAATGSSAAGGTDSSDVGSGAVRCWRLGAAPSRRSSRTCSRVHAHVRVRASAFAMRMRISMRTLLWLCSCLPSFLLIRVSTCCVNVRRSPAR